MDASLCSVSHVISALHTSFFFFFNDTATTEIYTLSLHDALPIYLRGRAQDHRQRHCQLRAQLWLRHRDRKSTRLNSSHTVISYAVFCLKKKKTIPQPTPPTVLALTADSYEPDAGRHHTIKS